ncbi:MAG: AAA family ATPase [Candidatus Campbellbacteria bacterium]|nr:AAA family ATPase [Candidatus Campbellbacteria bacterium]
MYLKSLELSGFKSFAKKASLEFKTPITAIVGPNGSGKSNIAESFRFVLGEQSIKSMRGKRTEDLIWNGSKTSPRSNRAHVKLTFDNTARGNVSESGRLFAIDFDEVVLERVIHRDATSEYRLNDSVVRLKDTIELLSGAHIGASGHHIISQGEADRILSVNTRERKAMIEDALGLKIYHYKKDESERKLEKTQENLDKVESIRRELKPHLAFLHKQVAKVEKARELALDLKQAYRDYFAREKAYLDATLKRITYELDPLEKRMLELQKDITHAREELQKLSQKDVTSDALLSSEEKMRSIREKKDLAVREVGRIEGEISALRTLLAKEERKQTEEAHKTVPFTSVSSMTTSLGRLIDSALSQGDPAEFKAALSAIKTLVSEFMNTVRGETARDNDIAEVRENISSLEHDKKKREGEIATLDAEEKKYAEEYKKIQHTIESDIHSGREMERRIFTLSNEQQEVRMHIQVLTSEKSTLKLEEEEYKRELLEAGALVGVEAVRFDDLSRALAESGVVEERSEQHERKRQIERTKVRLEDAGSGGGDDIMKEFEEVSQRDAFLEKEVADLEQSAESLHALITDLEETLAREFAEGVKKINVQFSEFFSLMFNGGNASLEIVREVRKIKRDTDIEDIEDDDGTEDGAEGEEKVFEGVEIHVALPRKKIHGLEMLSGGERALTSIALIFAMSQVNPPPFIILDETDAALDEANSKRYGDMIENLSKKTQLILITHNRETMSRAGVLYGITMGADAISQLLSVSFDEAVHVAK